MTKIKPKSIQRKCGCGRRVSKFHHFFCEKCWNKHRIRLGMKPIKIVDENSNENRKVYK